MKLLELLFNAIVAWVLGLAFIAATLYFTNGGADFTTTDLMGFGSLAVAASGLLMLVLYLPSLYWLKPTPRWCDASQRFPAAHRRSL